MKIRRAVIEDAKGISIVQVDTWKTTYKNLVPDAFLNQMTYESREPIWKDIISTQSVYVAETNDKQIIGYSNGGKEKSGKYPEYLGELYGIYILKAYQKKGLGRELLKAVVKDLLANDIRSMTVMVFEENQSQLFYKALGGVKIDKDELEISEEKLKVVVYGWKDIRTFI